LSKRETDIEEDKRDKFPDLYSRDGLEQELQTYSIEAVKKIRFASFIKPAIISLVALIFSFFLDLSYVPILGNISVEIAHWLFPAWNPAAKTISPYSFWWLPLIVYIFFAFLAYLAYTKLKVEIVRTPASETIDRIITSYTSVVDGIATALPLIGAAILLISIKLGEEVFLGLSVPFEVKSLVILAIGKLFEPVLDQLGIDFQNVVNHVKDIKDRYFSRLQLENSRNILKQLGGTGGGGELTPQLSVKELESYVSALEKASNLTNIMLGNFKSINAILDKVNSTPAISAEQIQQLKSLAESINTASKSLSDEKTIIGLKHLESIVKK
jgi:hypothetical protein